MNRIYLDWNATAPIRVEAVSRMVEVLSATGNPSSVHAEGRAARSIVETARREVADLVDASEAAVIFTGGGTEAIATALTPRWRVRGEAREFGLRSPGRDRTCVGARRRSLRRAGSRHPSRRS